MTRKKRVEEPRPECPECGAVMEPSQVVVYEERLDMDHLFCSSNCLLDAWTKARSEELDKQ